MKQEYPNWEDIDKCSIWKVLGVTECNNCDTEETCWGTNINLPEPENIWRPKATLICSNCNISFSECRTAEEALLQAIFGSNPLCKKCTSEKDMLPCFICGTLVKDPISLNHRHYCLEHLPYSKA